MNEARARELFLDHHRGTLSPEDRAALRAHLAASPALQREFAELARTLDTLDTMPGPRPTPRLRAGVFAAIEAEKNSVRAAHASSPAVAPANRRPLWLRLTQTLLVSTGACALLAVGFLMGARSSPPAAAIQPSAESATQRELAALRLKVDSMTQLVGYSILQQSQRSTSERLRGVLASASLSQPDDKTINDLIGALALDPSTNVRLNALDALYPHADQDIVRTGVLASLLREQNPLVQVSMIDFLVASRNRDAAPALDKLSHDDARDRSVRDAARKALTQL